MESHDYAKNRAPSSPCMSDSSTDHYTHQEQLSPAPILRNDKDRDALEPIDAYETYEARSAPIDNTKAEDIAKIDYEHHKNLWWYRVRYICREAFAEFCGTMIMIIFGDGSVAQVTLSANDTLPEASREKGDYQSISWGWGIGVMLGVYVAGLSGGHLNPAITMGKLPLPVHREILLTGYSQLHLPRLSLVETAHLCLCSSHWLLLWCCHHLRKLQVRHRCLRRLRCTHRTWIQRSRYCRCIQHLSAALSDQDRTSLFRDHRFHRAGFRDLCTQG